MFVECVISVRSRFEFGVGFAESGEDWARRMWSGVCEWFVEAGLEGELRRKLLLVGGCMGVQGECGNGGMYLSASECSCA